MISQIEIMSDSSRTEKVESLSTESKPSFADQWARAVNTLRRPTLDMLHKLSGVSARNPKRTISLVTFVSVVLLVIGIFTNFTVEADDEAVWTPRNSRAIKHNDWIEDESGFVQEARSAIMLFHSQGDNVLGYEQVLRVFEAMEEAQATEGYDEICALSNYTDPVTNQVTCEVSAVTKFWNNSKTTFLESVSNDEETIEALSSTTFPDGTRVSDKDLFGKPVRDENGLLVSATLFIMLIETPDLSDVDGFKSMNDDFEEKLLDQILDGIREDWMNDETNNFYVEIETERSFGDEFSRALTADMPLLPIVFIIMSVFTALMFAKRNAVLSQSLLGFSAVLSALFSMMASHGFMFICGVPYSSMHPLIPFIIFGISLDDAFVLSGYYDRTDRKKDVLDRIYDTIEECGISITLTTLTSTAAFALGCLSSIPTVFWLCLYAFPTIVIVWLFMVTFFVACIVLDEKRIQDNRRDCLTCLSVKIPTDREASMEDSYASKMMESYARFLMKPTVKAVVILGFAGLAVACGLSASNLTQEFKFTDVLPSDSYVSDFYESVDDYTEQSAVAPGIYFRFVNQSDPEIQAQMKQYVIELQTIDSIVEPPDFFWLDDFDTFKEDNSENLEGLTFDEQVVMFLDDPLYRPLYVEDIVFDSEGRVSASRTFIRMDNLDIDDVTLQIDAMEDQRRISSNQPINKGRDDWAFFTFEGIYYIWDFYTVAVQELIFTTVIGIVSVTALAMFFIPHWSASFVMLPFISILYVDLLGAIQWAGVHINAVSYISLVLSIGLMVDYLMHILLCYYETPGKREERVVEVLRTMGSAVLIGGASTLLGILPLAASTSEIFVTVFYSFLGLVTLGVGHGLILLPVVLSLIGPENDVLAEKPSSYKKKLTVEESI